MYDSFDDKENSNTDDVLGEDPLGGDPFADDNGAHTDDGILQPGVDDLDTGILDDVGAGDPPEDVDRQYDELPPISDPVDDHVGTLPPAGETVDEQVQPIDADPPQRGRRDSGGNGGILDLILGRR